MEGGPDGLCQHSATQRNCDQNQNPTEQIPVDRPQNLKGLFLNYRFYAIFNNFTNRKIVLDKEYCYLGTVETHKKIFKVNEVICDIYFLDEKMLLYPSERNSRKLKLKLY